MALHYLDHVHEWRRFAVGVPAVRGHALGAPCMARRGGHQGAAGGADVRAGAFAGAWRAAQTGRVVAAFTDEEIVAGRARIIS